MTSLLADHLTGEAPSLEHDAPSAASGAVLSTRFPARALASHWPGAQLSRAEVLALVRSPLGPCESRLENDDRRGLLLLLDWLEEQPGDTWHERWMQSGADEAREEWAGEPRRWLEGLGTYSPNRLTLMTASLLILIGADVVRPSLEWLLTGGAKRKVTRNIIRARDPEGFERLDQICAEDPAISPHASVTPSSVVP